MFVYHFVDIDLRVEEFFELDGPAENDFEIGDIGTYTHFFWRLKKNLCRACVLFYYLLVTKNVF